MRVQIVTRHCEVPESIRIRANDQASRLTRYEPHLAGVEIVFEVEKHTKSVEGILSIDGAPAMVASGEGPEFRPALDQMFDRAGRMLRRHREQVTDHQAPKLPEASAPDA